VSLSLSQASTSSSIPKYLETGVRYASALRPTGTQSIKKYAQPTLCARYILSIVRYLEKGGRQCCQTLYFYIQDESVCDVSRSSNPAPVRPYKDDARCTLHRDCSRRHKTRRHVSTTRSRQTVTRCDASHSEWGIPTTSSPASG
jgi:hypothetical protein